MLAEPGPMTQLNHPIILMLSPTEITVKEIPHIQVKVYERLVTSVKSVLRNS